MKPTDKAPQGGVSESPGRNESERRGGLETDKNPEAEHSPDGRRQQRQSKRDETADLLRRGGSDGMVTRAREATGEPLLVPGRNPRSREAL